MSGDEDESDDWDDWDVSMTCMDDLDGASLRPRSALFISVVDFDSYSSKLDFGNFFGSSLPLLFLLLLLLLLSTTPLVVFSFLFLQYN